jgi:glutamate N-acetyltransferase/amino-acid N-acetyltransferase
VKLAVAECNIRYKDRPDVLLAEFTPGTIAAGVFTTSLTAAAPVTWCRKALKNTKARALVVNSGNANAFTGALGMDSIHRTVQGVVANIGCVAEEVYIASTGVIGEPLSDDKIVAALPALKNALNENAWESAARSIMTTDTFMKVATKTAKIGDTVVTLNGFAKGSGMIAPNMATLLAFVFTDAAIPAETLQKLVSEANEISFNAITVDSDTSTNDTLMVFATGKAENGNHDLSDFTQALNVILTDLATQIVLDGEGAQKFVTIKVAGAKDTKSAKTIAMTIANSPLVKTAIAGEDANWGRIVAAVGRAGEYVEQDKIGVSVGGVLVAKDGARVEGFNEEPVAKHMKGTHIDILVELGLGNGTSTVYTCDLTHGYIDINGSYRS